MWISVRHDEWLNTDHLVRLTVSKPKFDANGTARCELSGIEPDGTRTLLACGTVDDIERIRRNLTET